jgi:5-methylcytosine-specific restriction endonuclease McrA
VDARRLRPDDLTAVVTADMDPALAYDPAAALARTAFALDPPRIEPPRAGSAHPPARTGDPPRDEIEPLTEALARLHITVTRQFLDKLEAGRDALSHSKPSARRAEILEAALDLLLARRDRRNGVVERPRATPRPSTSDAIPAHVKRAVWKRDRGCCQWRLPNGEICGSRTRLQFDHIEPRALGGESTVENVRLLCGPHNRLAARRILGDACVDLALRRRPSPRRVERARTGDGPGGG